MENLTQALLAHEQQNELLWLSSVEKVNNFTMFITENLTYNFLGNYLRSILLKLDEHGDKFDNISWSVEDIDDDLSQFMISTDEYYDNITTSMKSLTSRDLPGTAFAEESNHKCDESSFSALYL